ncbi:metal-dependent transcriptional regulator [Flammeovirga sp. MY04]|uniref:metal-dependent transcriptional regulator n=1 Tax=Flammeovirga sp. MY04 TaxID=1191459 RepID=UPI0008060E69|nr:metal-dependent transcriptional regulator [Flammeovirga sp. MY04]ANQ48384.1 metal-dependent transcriptional regulator [Flammeovirga sp. MY04]
MNTIFNWFKKQFDKYPLEFIEEDILKILFKIKEDKKEVRAKDIYNELVNVSDEAFNNALQSLFDKKDIKSTNEQISLEESGHFKAIQLIRKHRIYEKYLAEKTGFSKENWHSKAERKEHLLSDEEVDQMDKELGYPKFDPHGDPIPTKDGVLPKLKGRPLSKIKQNSLVKIIHIEDEPKEVYLELLKKDIHIGSLLSIQSTKDKLIYTSESRNFEFSENELNNIQVVIIETAEVLPKNINRLTDLKLGERAIIYSLSQECRGINRRRLLDLGFVKGSNIEISMVSPMRDPKAFLIRDTLIALRKEQTNMILIKKVNQDEQQ